MTSEHIHIHCDKPAWTREIHSFSHKAMATMFGVFVVYPDPAYAEQAAWAAFEELDRLESELSRFVDNSDIARINSLPPDRTVCVGLDAFECLRIAQKIASDTEGAFDITIGGLLDKLPGDKPATEREQIGWNLLELNAEQHTVCRNNEQIEIDLGGIGKGCAIDRMGALLRDWEVDIALIHGGYSTVLALECPLNTEGWPVTISDPQTRKTLRRFHLKNQALSASGLQKGAHIINPRTLCAAQGQRATWCSTRDAATADALSTAFMVMDTHQIERYCSRHTGTQAVLLLPGGEKLTYGI
ncbi:MAG: FAD:protein FMN transferase [bacterium]